MRVLEQLRPGYAERVTEALAAAQWHARSSQEAVDAAVASFVGVKEVQQWPVGGFEKRSVFMARLPCLRTSLTVPLTVMQAHVGTHNGQEANCYA